MKKGECYESVKIENIKVCLFLSYFNNLHYMLKICKDKVFFIAMDEKVGCQPTPDRPAMKRN